MNAIGYAINVFILTLLLCAIFEWMWERVTRAKVIFSLLFALATLLIMWG